MFRVGDKIKCIMDSCGCGGAQAVVTGVDESHYYIREDGAVMDERNLITSMEGNWELVTSFLDVKVDSSLLGTGIKCECGSESVGSGGHSTWCPKF